MPSEPTPTEDATAPHGEREQTDESLRVERQKADDAIDERRTAVDDTADAVLSRARARADEVIAAARAKSDRQSASRVPSVTVEMERVRADQVVRKERASADEAVRQERADQVVLISIEREGTDRDLLSERARADDALATRDEFLGVVGHDLRNMLSSVVGFAALIEEGVSREDHVESIRMHARRIQRSSGRMNRLIGDLLDVASIEAGVLAVTREHKDPALIVAEVVDTFAAQASAHGVSITAEIVSSPFLAAFDPSRILQVLTNFLSNALKFTPKGGKVVVRVERSGEDVCFAVSDTGEGIPRDKLETIFERFSQATRNDRRGVGLGLYISKCIVQGHGGRIWAESTLGQGSTFFCTLPGSSVAI